VRRVPDAPTALVHLGCKSGGIGLWLAEATRSHLIAVDPDAFAVETAMHACGGFDLEQFPSFQQAPFEATQLATGSAYAVTSLEALYLSQYPRDALFEAHRILDEGGVLLFDAYVADSDPAAAAWVQMLEHTGFDVLDIDDQTAHWRAVLRQQHVARLEYEGYLIERLGHKRAMQEIATSRALLSTLDGTRRIELVARRRRTRFARSSSRLVLRTPVCPSLVIGPRR
jgi:ubiquinone/menaquinone biosynthesis C-methylase UbiE